jgi:ABC-2 type transport system ATP-binding protein
MASLDPTSLELNGATKAYGDFTLGPISLAVGKGEVVAFVGKNGSGKSTLFQLLTGNADLSGGKIAVMGQNMTPDRYLLKRKIGYLPQHPVLPKWVTGAEVLSYASLLHRLPEPEVKIEESLKFWDCADYKQRPLGACSHGMQKRVCLALATIHAPPLLILDEPFSGLDVFHSKALEETIAKRRASDQITLLSTHIAPYTAKMCDRAFVLDNGRLEEFSGFADLDFVGRIGKIESHFF